MKEITKWKKSIIKGMIYFLIIANILDTVCTDIGLRYGHIKEGNIFMELAYNYNPLLFYTIKLFGVTLGLLLLYRVIKVRRDLKVIAPLTYVAFGAYAYVIALHTIWISSALN